MWYDTEITIICSGISLLDHRNNNKFASIVAFSSPFSLIHFLQSTKSYVTLWEVPDNFTCTREEVFLIVVKCLSIFFVDCAEPLSSTRKIVFVMLGHVELGRSRLFASASRYECSALMKVSNHRVILSLEDNICASLISHILNLLLIYVVDPLDFNWPYDDTSAWRADCQDEALFHYGHQDGVSWTWRHAMWIRSALTWFPKSTTLLRLTSDCPVCFAELFALYISQPNHKPLTGW